MPWPAAGSVSRAEVRGVGAYAVDAASADAIRQLSCQKVLALCGLLSRRLWLRWGRGRPW